MTCPCHSAKEGVAPGFLTRPTEQCDACAAKHFATAWALARENGYGGANKMRIIGELVLSQWHIWQKHRDIALVVRDLRHEVGKNQVDEERWASIAEKFAAMETGDAKG